MFPAKFINLPMFISMFGLLVCECECFLFCLVTVACRRLYIGYTHYRKQWRRKDLLRGGVETGHSRLTSGPGTAAAPSLPVIVL